ncbi:plasma membrane fusion protein prm1 [Linnemannia schmuckeri]|uniref:Plasma membrane fusion protein PRM1 n=1 Tax=Linnemannia schmuckeri TaxID=64567 RepID=A0A9P5VAH7_9FUNG|nr:plasma membrane fusion protein prm1 [Linnemannia schmuckeri]
MSPSSSTPPKHTLYDDTPTRVESQPVQPFLGLQAKLSQAFASYAVVFFVISAFQLYKTRTVIGQFAADAKVSVAQECYALEKSLSTVATLPNMAAQGINRGLVNAVESSISQVGYGLVVVLTGLISTLDLIMGLLTGTWRCFLANLADSGIPLLSDVGVEGVQAIDELNDAVLDLLAVPFNGLGELIERKMADPQIGNLVAIPVMTIPKIVFCEEALDLAAVDKLASGLRQWISYGTMILLATAFAVVLGNMVVIWCHHRRWMTHVGRVQQQLSSIAAESSGGQTKVTPSETQQEDMDLVDKQDDPEQKKLDAMRISDMVQHPALYRFMDWSSKRLFKTDEIKRNIYLWFLHYVSHPPAIVCLFIGLLGLVLTAGKIALIEYMRQNYRTIFAPAIADLSETIINSVQGAMQTASVTFSTETNSALAVVEADLNEAVFSEIIRAAVDLNSALVQVQTTLVEGVRTVFGESIFAKFAGAVLQCLLFNKLEAVGRGLSWVQDNAQIRLPRVTEDMLVMDRTQLNALVVESANTLMSPSSSVRGEKIENAMSRVYTQYEDALRRELPVYYGLVTVWLIILVLGLTGAARAAGVTRLTDGSGN